MPYWYYDKKDLLNTPSYQDGIDNDTENRYRKEGARFIINTGSNMDLGYNTVATGVVYFHRFYMFHSFRDFPRYITACCCLFLAGKVEETPKKCKDIIKQAKALLTEHKFASFGEDPKEEVMTLERILLQTIKFDLQVEHPYGYLLKYAKSLKGDKGKLQKMVQMAWTFVNDSLCTTLCLQWEPEVIAVALMFLAGKLSKFEVVDWNGRTQKQTAWWDMFVEDITTELLEDICHQVLDLYSPQPQSAGGESPPLPPAPSKNEKKPSATQPTSTSSTSNILNAKPTAVTPVKNGSDVLKAEGLPRLPTIEPPIHFPPAPPSFPPISAYPPTYTAPPPMMNMRGSFEQHAPPPPMPYDVRPPLPRPSFPPPPGIPPPSYYPAPPPPHVRPPGHHPRPPYYPPT